jgi:polar amino acid transport system permease protein
MPGLETSRKAVMTSSGSLDRLEVPADVKVIPPRHYGRIVVAAVILTLLFGVAYAFANASLEWGAVLPTAFSDLMLSGVVGTLKLTFAAMAVGVVGGVVVAVLRQSANPVARWVATGYIWIFRGVPALVQLVIWYNLAVVIPTTNIPFVYSGSTNALVTPWMAAVLGLGLAEAANMAEIVRGGVNSVGEGQIQAAKSLGMSAGMTMRRVILPQSVPVIIPPTGNEVINMLKYTSLAFAVSYSELLSTATRIYSVNLKVVEVLFAAVFWYLILCTVFGIFQSYLERRFSNSSVRHGKKPRRGTPAARRNGEIA